jgi:hypothetical protein
MRLTGDFMSYTSCRFTGNSAMTRLTRARCSSSSPTPAFDDLTEEIVPVNKQAIFQEFMAVRDWEDDSPSHETVGSAEAALASLVEHGMVEVADDQLTVPTRFVPEGAKQRRPSEPAEGTVPE